MVGLPVDLFQLFRVPASQSQSLSFRLRSFVRQVDAGSPSPELGRTKESLQWSVNDFMSAVRIWCHLAIERIAGNRAEDKISSFLSITTRSHRSRERSEFLIDCA